MNRDWRLIFLFLVCVCVVCFLLLLIFLPDILNCFPSLLLSLKCRLRVTGTIIVLSDW